MPLRPAVIPDMSELSDTFKVCTKTKYWLNNSITYLKKKSIFILLHQVRFKAGLLVISDIEILVIFFLIAFSEVPGSLQFRDSGAS